MSTGSCCDVSPKTEGAKVELATTKAQKSCCTDQPAKSLTAAASAKSGAITELAIIWQRLVSTDGRTCPRCDATYQHLQSAIVKLKEALKPLNIVPALEVREIDDRSFKNKPAESNRIWIADKPIEEWIGAGVGRSKCCSVCGDEPCRTMEVGGTVFEEIPETIILKAAMIAASELVSQTA
jgi:hypothetical protein